MRKEVWFTLGIGLVFLCLTCCISGPDHLAPRHGRAIVSTAQVPQESGWIAHIVFSRGKHELSQTIEVTGAGFTSEIKIPVGTWDIAMYLVDENDTVIYQDTQKGIVIYPDEPTLVNFQLSPASGQVSVVIDLGDFPQQEQVLRARIHFNEDVKEIIRTSPLEPLEAEYSIPPGSYDFKVELFTASFRATDKIDPGVWQPIHIEPLSEQTLAWSPFMQDLMITVDIFLVPAAPLNLTATYGDLAVALSWAAPDTELIMGHSIFWQLSPFEPFELVAHVDRTEGEFVHDLSDIKDLPATIYYTIASFSEKLTGYRSSPVQVNIQ